MNIFIRTSIAPYRVDIYNALHNRMNMKMCYYERIGRAQKFDIDDLESKCSFKPHYLRGITFKSHNRKWCLGLWEMLQKENPEIVIVPEFQISAIQVLLHRWFTRSNYKVVSMTDDSYDMIASSNDFTKLHGWLRKHISKYFDDFIVVTPEVEQWYQEKYHKGIWMPIIMDDTKMTTYYEQLLPKSRLLVEKYGLAGKKVLLSVSRLVDLKNLHRVIDAFAKCKTDATLVIVGDGVERDSLELHAKQVNKDIIFTGRFDGDDLYAWYNLASAFVLASYLEPFGAVTNEALLAGCRVIISERAGSSCLVCEHNGELINPMDVEAISEAFERQLRLATIPNLSEPRKSLMTISFEERTSSLIKILKTKKQ